MKNNKVIKNLRVLRFVLIIVFLVSLKSNVFSQYLYESFEGTTFPPTGWTLLNPTNGTGWERVTENIPAAGWNGVNYPSTNAGNFFAIANYITGTANLSGTDTIGDQWLISPAITISSGDMLTCNLWFLNSGYNDSLDIMLSTTNNTNASFFNTVLANYDSVDFVNQTWISISINLSSYAGQTVYIAFREHCLNNIIDGSLFALDAVGIGLAPAADVAVQSIDIPALNTTTAFIPTATVGNLGSTNQSFTVDMTITPGGYTSSQNVSNLAAGGYTQVNFAPFTTTNSNYSVTVTATLLGDVDTTNNSMTSTFIVYQLDSILFDNTNIATDNSIVSTLFGGLPSGQDLINCADDFIVPSSVNSWTITCIKTSGTPSITANNTTIDRFTYVIYNDNANAPGTIFNTGSITTAKEGTNLGLSQTLALSSPVTLNPGKYWLSVFAEYDTATTSIACRWNWNCGPTLIGDSAHIQSTTSLFAQPFSWTALSNLVAGEESFYYIIYGNTSGFISTIPNLVNASPTSICTGGSSTLTFTGGNLASGDYWAWFSGSCGGTFEGTGTSLTISPTATTTYFVRAEGANNTTTCVSTTVILNTLTTTANFNFGFSGNNSTYQFIDSSITSSNNTITNWSWAFGDGHTSTIQNPTHVYLAIGAYPVCVTVNDTLGCSDTFCDSVTVNVIAANCNIYVTYTTTNESTTGANDGSINLTVNGGTIPYTYSWSNGAVIEDILNLAMGYYNVTVNDNAGCATFASVYVSDTSNAIPVATLSNIPQDTCLAFNYDSVFVYSVDMIDSTTIDVVWAFLQTLNGTIAYLTEIYHISSLGYYNISIAITCNSKTTSVYFGHMFVDYNSLLYEIADNTLLNSINIYPNPANETINITNAEKSNISIYNLLGEVVLKAKSSSANATINVSKLSEGTYIIKVIGKERVVAKKLVIKK